MKIEGVTSSLETQVFSASALTSGVNPALNDSTDSEAANRDLGFGEVVSRTAHKRFLNRDGSFNVRRDGTSLIGSKSLYHFCLNSPWSIFLLMMFSIYMFVNLFFGLSYFACGPGALEGSDGTNTGSRFLDCFFFSVQTFATIGYGRMSPHGLPANLLVTVEALVGLMGLALATGLFYARFSRPTARILFSKFAVLAPYRGVSAFQFRIANQRSNQLMHMEVRLILSRFERDGTDLKRKFYELELERSRVMFFPLNWTIVHPIDSDSPLFGLKEEDLSQSDAEFLVLLAGIDDTFSQTVYASSSYKHDEIVWHARFVNILEEDADGSMKIDLNRIHEIERTPAVA